MDKMMDLQDSSEDSGISLSSSTPAPSRMFVCSLSAFALVLRLFRSEGSRSDSPKSLSTSESSGIAKAIDFSAVEKEEGWEIGGLYYLVWTNNAAFERFLFSDERLNLLFAEYLRVASPESSPILKFFNELYNFMDLDFEAKREDAIAFAKRINATYVSRESSERLRGISKGSREKLAHELSQE
jgi:hypothetical protein